MHLEMFWESCVMHVASKLLWPRSLKTEVASFPVIMSTQYTIRAWCSYNSSMPSR
jgi:hypothetical protein